MKVLFLLISFVLVSCGGSSGSDGNSKVRGPQKPNGPRIGMSLENAKAQLALREDTFENIQPGDSFIKYELCSYTSSQFGSTSGRFVRNFTVVSYDRSTREISYKVDAIETPDIDSETSCNGTEITESTYILMDYLPTMDAALSYFDSLNNLRMFLTDLNGEKFIVANGEFSIDSSDEPANVEIGINLTKNFLIGMYMETNIYVKEYDLNANSSSFALEKGKVDISNIDLSKLPVYYEDSSINLFQ